MGYLYRQFTQELISDVQVRRISPKALSAYQDFLPPHLATVEGKPIYYGATAHGQPCGLLVAKTQDQSCDILHIQVAKPVQRAEVGSRLIMALQRNMCQVSDATHIYVSIPVCDGEEDLTPFFSANGFVMRGTASEDFTFPLMMLTQNKAYHKLDSLTPLADTYPLLSMPASAWVRFTYSFGSTIPQELSPELVPGELLPQFSLAYLYHGEVSAFVLFSKLSEDTIFLAAAYAKPKHSAWLLNLLKQSFDAILANPGSFTTMKITTTNAKPLHILEHFIERDTTQAICSKLQLLSWCVEDVRTQESVRVTEKLDLLLSQDLDGDVAFLMPRILRLSDMLEERGYEPSLTAVGDVPGVIFFMGDLLTTMTYSYVAQGKSACQLSLLQRHSTNLSENELRFFLDMFNHTSLSAVALSMEEQMVLLRDNFLEPDAPITEGHLDTFLALVSQSAMTLQEMILIEG